MKTRSLTGCLIGLVVLSSSGVAFAQRVPDRGWEFSLGAWLAGLRSDTTYTHAYTPKVDFHDESTGTAGHRMALRFADRAFGDVAVSRTFGGHFGIELLAGSGRIPIDGASSAYRYHLEYEALVPPSYDPTWVKIDSSQAWPAPRGTVQNDVVALDVVAIVPARSGFQVRFSAGASAHRLSGSVESLAYTRFWLGGHSVLFSETHRLRARIEPLWKLGFNVGGELSYPVVPGVYAFLEGRYLWVSTTELALTPSAVLNERELAMGLTTDEIAQRMPLRRLELEPSLIALGAGVRFRL